jgi:hypothetical protein
MPPLVMVRRRRHLVALSLLLFSLAVAIQLYGVFHAGDAYVQQAAFMLAWLPAAVACIECAYASTTGEESGDPGGLTDEPLP